MEKNVVMKTELSQNVKLLIYRSVFVPSLYGHEGRVMTKQMRLQIQAAEMGSIRWVASISLRDKERNSGIHERFGVELLFCCTERSQLR